MEQYRKDLIHLHIIVFIYGFTAILGRLIGLQATDLVWYRVLIAFVSLGALMIYRKVSWQRLTSRVGKGNFLLSLSQNRT